MQWLPAILTIPYLILIIRFFTGLLKIKPFTPGSDSHTKVSLIIPCRNEEKTLPELLDRICNQEYPHNLLEIIVIDDNSSDSTFRIASEFRSPFKIICITNPGKGKKMAVRHGIHAALGELIITTDADCRPGKSWISTVASFYEKNGADLIIAPVVLESANTFLGRFQDLEFLSLQGVTAGSALIGNPVMCNAANLAFTRKAYLKHTESLHYETDSGDDVFLLHSIKKDRTMRTEWLESENAVTTTKGIYRIDSFIRQRMRWIGKSTLYTDRFTITTGIVTFVTILALLSSMIAAIINPENTGAIIVTFLSKAMVDFLILWNTTSRYRKRNLLWWFIPSQIIYPFYVLTVTAASILITAKWKD